MICRSVSALTCRQYTSSSYMRHTSCGSLCALCLLGEQWSNRINRLMLYVGKCEKSDETVEAHVRLNNKIFSLSFGATKVFHLVLQKSKVHFTSRIFDISVTHADLHDEIKSLFNLGGAMLDCLFFFFLFKQVFSLVTKQLFFFSPQPVHPCLSHPSGGVYLEALGIQMKMPRRLVQLLKKYLNSFCAKCGCWQQKGKCYFSKHYSRAQWSSTTDPCSQK